MFSRRHDPIPTLTVVNRESGRTVIINESDFDPERHQLPGELITQLLDGTTPPADEPATKPAPAPAGKPTKPGR